MNVMEFLRRFLQHVLPTGFMKVRYYGFLHPSSAVPLEKVAALIEMAYRFEIVKTPTEIEPFELPTCGSCGGKLELIASVHRYGPIQARAG